MKVWVGRDELWPLYELDDEMFGQEIELSEEDVEFVTLTMEHFWQVQAIMDEAYLRAIESE